MSATNSTIMIGTAAERPEPPVGHQPFRYVATDTGQRSVWNGTTWAVLAYQSPTTVYGGMCPPLVGGTTQFLRADGTWAAPPAQTGSDPWAYIKLAQNFQTSSATAVGVAGLSFAPVANGSQEFVAVLMLRTNTATVNPRVGLSWPTGMSDGVAQIMESQAATGTPLFASGNVNAALLTAVGGLPNATQSWPARIDGMVRAGASPSGRVQVQLASETAGTSVSIMAGSYLAYRTI